MNATYKTLGTDDAVNTCDCCGKSNLKFTVVMECIESGNVVHFGSTCATRHSGRKLSAITSEIETRQRAISAAVEQAMRNSAEGRAYQAALSAALEAHIPPGAAFKAFVQSARVAAQALEISLKAQFSATL